MVRRWMPGPSQRRTQLDVVAYGHPCLDEIAIGFEADKEGLMGGCRPFADAGAAIERLEHAEVPVLVCSKHAR